MQTNTSRRPLKHTHTDKYVQLVAAVWSSAANLAETKLDPCWADEHMLPSPNPHPSLPDGLTFLLQLQEVVQMIWDGF